MFKVNNKDTKQRKKEHQSNLTDIVLVSLLITLNITLTFFQVFLMLSVNMYSFA